MQTSPRRSLAKTPGIAKLGPKCTFASEDSDAIEKSQEKIRGPTSHGAPLSGKAGGRRQDARRQGCSQGPQARAQVQNYSLAVARGRQNLAPATRPASAPWVTVR